MRSRTSLISFTALTMTLLTAALLTPADAAPPTAAVSVPPGDALQVREGIRVVYGVGQDAAREGVGQGLFFVNRLLDNYDAAKIAPTQRAVVVVLYDQSAYWLLNERAWAAYKGPRALSGDTNPNAALLARLIARGVHVEVCGTTLKKKGWTKDDLLPGVHVVPGAYARIVDLQLQGFAHIAFD